MALSNWDTMAFDEAGQPTNGVFETPLGVQVEIYKNWLYIRDAKAWREDGEYVEPTVMEIQEGRLHYLDLHVLALRGPQNGVYCVVWHTKYQEQEKGEPYRPPIVTGMVGMGVYGFRGEEWVGAEEESVRWFVGRLQKKEPEDFDGLGTHEFYVLNVPDVFRQFDWGRGLRFNQGDAYLADRLGEETPATEVGQQQKPMLMKMLGEKEE